MRLTVRQIIVGTIPTVAAIFGFLWFRRKKDPAICWKQEVPDKEKVESSETAASQNSQRQNDGSEKSVATEQAASVVVEEPVSVVKAEPLLLSKVAESSQHEKPTSDKVSDISEGGISSIESQILPVCVKTTEVLPSTSPDSLQETSSSEHTAVLGKQNEQSSIAESTHKETSDTEQHLSNGIEASIEQSIIADLQASIEPEVTESNVSQTSESTPAVENQSANEVVLVSESVVSAPKSAEELLAAPSEEQSAESSAGQTRDEDLKAGGDENANTKSASCTASKSKDYSLTNGHTIVNGEDEQAAGDASHAKTTSQQASQQTTVDGDQSNGDGTDAQSEVSSDSGRGASGIETPTVSSPSELSDYVVYEFDFPSDYCGKLIGKAGKNINSVKAKTGAEIILKRKPFVRDYQNCCIEGTQAQVQAALEHIKRRFPQKQFGNISYRQTNVVDEVPVLAPEIMQLSLPEGVSVDVVVSSVVAANHIFVQQPTHPTFSSLESLNYCMNACYTQDNVVPQLPRPIDGGVICAAPVFQGWYRAQVIVFYPDTDECDIKYVDYGGYMRVGAATLRQIRSDFATLPFQAVECYLANVMPLEGDEEFGVEASVLLESLVQGQMLQAQITEHEADGTPYIQIYNLSGVQAVFVNRELVDSGTARWVETQG